MMFCFLVSAPMQTWDSYFIMRKVAHCLEFQKNLKKIFTKYEVIKK